MTNTIRDFVQERIDVAETEYQERRESNTLDSEDRGYFEGIIDAYYVILNHIDKYTK